MKQSKQQWKCLDCNRFFVRAFRDARYRSQRRWFIKYVEGYTLKQLVEISGLSKATICRIIDRELGRDVPAVAGLENVTHVVFDGKYLFGNRSCLVMIFDALTKRPVTGKITLRESQRLIEPFLEELRQAGLKPVAVTTDGNNGAIKAFQAVWPSITTQRCLFHIERQSLSWCRMRTRYLPAQDLKYLVRGLTRVTTRQQAQVFTRDFFTLCDIHRDELGSYDRNHKVQSDILKAYTLISNALENMFHYLDDPYIAHTTNIVESYFKQIQNIKGYRHNGLTLEHLTQLINWKIHHDTHPKK